MVINGNKTILLSLSHPLWMAFLHFLSPLCYGQAV
nr:MAG TPA: hypothetical protein [Caudoviricetes sp.]